ncbi:alpha/beta hydrolase [Bifidobacterium animalis subsp. lactis]|uniref:HAD family hydrolase n=1 Tax=Bifidobacterium animalis TaxID=28025 RepID=UPI001020F09F|nr:HAD family hydrolase [Bifidobacterium animalis]RYM94718.1 alpha/beta hydrolase [Bifidobacterium animalis subsp. lactis]RYM94818.1 alpha/beta hydrolase [Bifidobacterium animalis subsp. lactis]
MQTDFSAVVFDYFDVLVDWRPHRVVGAFYPPGVTDMFFDDHDPHGYEFCRARAAAGVPDGKILDDYTREHGPAVGWILRLLLQHRALGFYDMPVGMPTLLRELRAAGVRMVGLANCSETAVEQMQVKYPWLGLLDGTMVSARECIAKPDPALFERAIRAFHLDTAHTLFVENTAANAAACEPGLHAVRFESAEQIRALLLPVS